MTSFLKMHGLGNDFAIFDARTFPVPIDAATAKAVADRRRGIGSDRKAMMNANWGGVIDNESLEFLGDAVLGLVVVNAMKHSPWATFTVFATLPIAVFVGFYLRHWRPGQVLEGSLIGLVLGAVGGAIAGTIAESGGNSGPGIEVTVQTDAGQTVTVAQRDDGDVQLGDRVQIVQDGRGVAKVMRDTSRTVDRSQAPAPNYAPSSQGARAVRPQDDPRLGTLN